MSAAAFKDHFSVAAHEYDRFRPAYPPALIDFLAAVAPARRLAWDCATGTGQAAVALAERFERVIASDASAAQVGHAVAHPRVDYRVATAEDCGLPSRSAELVTVAQALHWLDLDAFTRKSGGWRGPAACSPRGPTAWRMPIPSSIPWWPPSTRK